jgi:hypothetical protein
MKATNRVSTYFVIIIDSKNTPIVTYLETDGFGLGFALHDDGFSFSFGLG